MVVTIKCPISVQFFPSFPSFPSFEKDGVKTHPTRRQIGFPFFETINCKGAATMYADGL